MPALHDSRKRGSRPSSRQRTDRKATASPMLAAHAMSGGIAGLPSNGAAVTTASTSQPGALTSVAQQLAEMRRQLDNEQQRLNMRMKMSEVRVLEYENEDVRGTCIGNLPESFRC